MNTSFNDVLAFVEDQFKQARQGSEEIVFLEKYSASESLKALGPKGGIRAEAPSITDVPRFQVLKHSKGQSAWAVILCVDLRGSSSRAVRIGAEHTYITMHTYLPTMAHLVEEGGGKVVGLRGDGLFAGFGVTELDGTNREVAPEVAGNAARDAVTCGKAMIEAVEDAINPVLEDGEIEGGLSIGVGVDVGNVVITRIGWESASEVTAYGHPVNKACKDLVSKATSSIRISKGVKDIYPSGKRGRVKFSHSFDAFTVDFPSDMLILEREPNSIRRRSPR